MSCFIVHLRLYFYLMLRPAKSKIPVVFWFCIFPFIYYSLFYFAIPLGIFCFSMVINELSVTVLLIHLCSFRLVIQRLATEMVTSQVK